MTTVLVTGTTGALGQAVVNHLHNDTQFKVIPTSRTARDGYVQLDVCDPQQVSDVLTRTRPHIILHLAATLSHDFNQAFAINVQASRHILETIQQSGLHTRILLTGSAAEYGVIQPEENPVSEAHALHPVSVYGLTKAWQTQLAGYHAMRGVDVVVARVFNLDGPNLSEQLFVGRLQKQIDEVLAGQRNAIELGPLTAVRDYIDMHDAVRQLLAIARFGKSGMVYHVASGEPITMRDLLERYLKKHHLDAAIVRESTALSNRVGYDVPTIYADMTRTHQLMEKETAL